MSNLHIEPITLKAANEFVTKYHRHHKPTVGHKFSISCVQDGIVRGGSDMWQTRIKILR